MKFRRRKRHGGGVEASALADILFFLMLFFLMVSTLASPEAIKVLLPKSNTGASIPRHTIYVTIDAEKHYFLNKQELNVQSLKEALAQEAKGQDNATVVIKVDRTVPVQEFIDVVDIANQLKLPVVVATEKKTNATL
jgi:biopolymer transport protein ExbD